MYDVTTSQPPGGTAGYLTPSFINTGNVTLKELPVFLVVTPCFFFFVSLQSLFLSRAGRTWLT